VGAWKYWNRSRKKQACRGGKRKPRMNRKRGGHGTVYWGELILTKADTVGMQKDRDLKTNSVGWGEGRAQKYGRELALPLKSVESPEEKTPGTNRFTKESTYGRPQTRKDRTAYH